MSVGRLERLGGGLAVGADDDLLDLLFRRLQLGLAMAPQQGAAAIEGDRFLKVDAAAFQLGDDFVQRLQRGLEAHRRRSEEHTSELQSLMRISYAVFCLK